MHLSLSIAIVEMKGLLKCSPLPGSHSHAKSRGWLSENSGKMSLGACGRNDYSQLYPELRSKLASVRRMLLT